MAEGILHSTLREVEWEPQPYIKPWRGHFHKWVVIKDRIYAIVELENGKMTTVSMCDINFVDDDRKENEE